MEKTKAIEPNQKALDALPFASGDWKVKNIRGLFVRARKTSKSFMLARRVGGKLHRISLGPLTMAEAKQKAVERWNEAGRTPGPDTALTLGAAIEDYIEAKSAAGKLAPKTITIMRYNTARYLSDWTGRGLPEIGATRLEIRRLQQDLTKRHGPSTSNQVVRLMSAVYRWARKVDTRLPENPMVVAEIVHIPARDWAYTPDELRGWWSHCANVNGKPVARGVVTLGPVKRMWWITALLTGARAGSIEALRWDDLNVQGKRIHFSTAKGGKVYHVPMSDLLAAMLEHYRNDTNVPPSEWVFPSSKTGGHLVGVKDTPSGVGPAHRLRHSFRTTLAQLGAGPDASKLLLGHSLGRGVSEGYVSVPLMIESLRPWANRVGEYYCAILAELCG
jgi:integrase